jgi:putative hydrolase of the HAD superfamily
VAYTDSRVEQGFPRSHALLVAAGAVVDYAAFLERWAATFDEFDRRTQASLDEYAMDDVCGEFLRRVLPRAPGGDLVAQFRDAYLDEWNKGVRYIPGVTALLAGLSARFTLVLVTNTHHAALVHGHLHAMGAAPYFPMVITSIEHGKRKPARSIFDHALERSSGKPESSVYVGDTYAADYLGARGAGLRGLLIDPEDRHGVPPPDRLAHILEARRLLQDG